MKNSIKTIIVVFIALSISGYKNNRLAIKSQTYNFKTKDTIINGNYVEEVITLRPRSGIKQRFILSKPKDKIQGIVILFAGGNGKLLLHKDESKWKTSNFLVRTRGVFASNNYVVATIDSPSKRKNGMKDGFRTSDKHLIDIKAVIKYLQNKYNNKKIWLIGTSRGVESVAYLGIALQNTISGIIFTSSVTNSDKYKRGTAILDMDLEKINIPTLIISHENDGCIVTPSSDSPNIYNMLNSKINKKLIYVNGGYEKSSNPCKAKTHHGFLGIENNVINLIINFMENN